MKVLDLFRRTFVLINDCLVDKPSSNIVNAHRAPEGPTKEPRLGRLECKKKTSVTSEECKGKVRWQTGARLHANTATLSLSAGRRTAAAAARAPAWGRGACSAR
ncbi:hypothetical protein EVAR_75923_1 [Eumeta japonica]|uniref:Uncharacterized protein n=1 Tax=Eumeta variegata TaxID=151549 RepID=A0A4C1UWU4_EUMVA|nr:hypothetical protein EVAR_75923_1 [Eumeta japonica]